MRNYFELPPAAIDPPYAGGPYVGCAAAVCADIVTAYTGEVISDLGVLFASMTRRHRDVDPTCDHGIRNHGACGYCIYLECFARGVPIRYAKLTWAAILAQVSAGHHVACSGIYGQIAYVAPGTYSSSKPALGRSDSFTGSHMIDLFGVAGGRIRTLDPDFGNQRGTPPYSLLETGQVEAFYTALGYPVAFTTAPPGSAPTVLHYHASVVVATALWNDATQRWRYRIPAGTPLVVRSKGFTKGGVGCYAVASLPLIGPGAGPGYFVPRLHIRLLGGPF